MLVAGIAVRDWYAMFLGTHSLTSSGIARNAWPDGDPYLKQEQIAVVMFDEIESALIESAKKK